MVKVVIFCTRPPLKYDQVVPSITVQKVVHVLGFNSSMLTFHREYCVMNSILTYVYVRSKSSISRALAYSEHGFATITK